jgi:dimethylglycine dehydrogenase
MNVMRMEKGFKGAGELTNEVTLAEADVLRFARTDKDYLGRDKTLTRRPALGLRLSGDRPASGGAHDGHGGEAVLLDGEVVGSTASVAFGHTVGTILAFAYIKPEAAPPATH